jgi:hypothetical protein
MAKFTDEDPIELPEGDFAESEEFIFEPADYNGYINSACNVLDAIRDYEPLTRDNQLKKARILRKCLRIVEHSVDEIYKELFDQDEEEEN